MSRTRDATRHEGRSLRYTDGAAPQSLRSDGFWVTPKPGEDIVTLTRQELVELIRLIDDEAGEADEILLASARQKFLKKLPSPQA